ncbi:MAG: hypothetical protein RLN85_18170 [Pseudomonadales bacterium]
MMKAYDRPNPSQSAGVTRLIALSLALAATIGGCASPETNESASAAGSTELAQSAFRIRSSETEPLNTSSGWAAAVNQNASINVDDPFRIRFEVENTSDSARTHSFGLEYKHNDGPWKPLLAEDFPYPIKDYAIEFSESTPTNIATRFDIINGEDAVFTSEPGDNGNYLRTRSGNQPLLALGRYDTLWEAVEYGASMRLSKGNTAGIVFGYQDPRNHFRVDATGGGDIHLVKVTNGRESILSTQEVGVKPDQWIEVKIVRNDHEIEVEYEWDDFIEGIVFSADVGQHVPESKIGIYLPPGSTSDFEEFAIEGQTRSPRVSIISSPMFDYGDPTENLIDGSGLPFSGGHGISYGDRTPGWTVSQAHGEWEFPIVLRYFSDGAKRNLPGDVFEFRMVDESGLPFQSSSNPRVTAEVPDGHLGGTYVETPVRVGPWEASNGDLYFLMEPSETDNMMMMVKSEDGGKSWYEVDGENRPKTGDLEGVAQTRAGDQVYTLHQTSDHVFQHVFRTSDHPNNPDTWAFTDERLASPVEPPTQVADLAVRSDGSVVGVYGNLEKVLYKVRSPQGIWGEETIVDTENDRGLSGPVVTLGKDDVVHFAYTGNDGTAWYRQILPNGEMTQRQMISSGMGTTVESNGAVLPLVYLPESDSLSIIYRLDNGELWERTANSARELSKPKQVTSHAVVTNAADSEQAGADAVGYGSSVHVLYIEEGSGRIYHTYRGSGGEWHSPEIAVDGVNALWVRGQVIKKNDQGAVYGYVYDAGSFGGSGMNKYAEIPLPPLK